MTGPIQSPVKGQPMRASWGAAVSSAVNSLLPMGSDGLLARQGVAGSGFSPLPANLRDRRAASQLHPWKVFAVGKSATVDHCFEIYVPDEVLHVCEHEIEIEGLTQVEGKEFHYTLDCEDEISGSAVIYLAIVRKEEDEDETGGVSPSGDGEQPNWKARIISTLDSIEDEKGVLAVLPIAKLSIDDSGEYAVGKVVSQYAHSAVALSENGADPDKVSIDLVTAEDAKDKNALQVKDFDNGESDGGQGLAERLELEKSGSGESATYRIKAKSNDSKVHILARVNGKIKYIPISGNEEKDPDEENPPPDPSDCDHPGDNGNEGGVNQNDVGHGGGGGSAGGGGVSPGEGGTHPGDDGCNCD